MTAPRPSALGIPWLFADMTLVTMMTVLVKLGGATYPAVQMVFIRSLIGLLTILPIAWHHRSKLRTSRWTRHTFRVLCNTIALNANFAALTSLPLVLVNAFHFTRPLIVMALATFMLNERSGPWRWIGAVTGLIGVLVIVGPFDLTWNTGIIAAVVMVIFGSLATVQTRALASENTTLIMIFYTVGLTLFTSVPAFMAWEAVDAADWPMLLGIGVLAQLGQYCFLRAYQTSPANILAPFGYFSIVFSSAAGFLAFGEVPAITTWIGLVIIILGVVIANQLDQRESAFNRNI